MTKGACLLTFMFLRMQEHIFERQARPKQANKANQHECPDVRIPRNVGDALPPDLCQMDTYTRFGDLFRRMHTIIHPIKRPFRLCIESPIYFGKQLLAKLVACHLRTKPSYPMIQTLPTYQGMSMLQKLVSFLTIDCAVDIDA